MIVNKKHCNPGSRLKPKRTSHKILQTYACAHLKGNSGLNNLREDHSCFMQSLGQKKGIVSSASGILVAVRMHSARSEHGANLAHGSGAHMVFQLLTLETVYPHIP